MKPDKLNIHTASTEDVQALLDINRRIALEEANERSQRLAAIFRRSYVFEKTFQTILKRANTISNFPSEVTSNLPSEYFDPSSDYPFQKLAYEKLKQEENTIIESILSEQDIVRPTQE